MMITTTKIPLQKHFFIDFDDNYYTSFYIQYHVCNFYIMLHYKNYCLDNHFNQEYFFLLQLQICVIWFFLKEKEIDGTKLFMCVHMLLDTLIGCFWIKDFLPITVTFSLFESKSKTSPFLFFPHFDFSKINYNPVTAYLNTWLMLIFN